MSSQPTPDPPQPTQTGTSAPIDQGLQTQAQSNGMPPHPGGPYARPTLQQMNAAMQYIRLAEEAYSDRRRNFQTVRVSEHEKEAYMQHFDQLWRAVQETEKKLIMYHSLFGDEASTSKLVAIIVTTKEQKKLLTTPAAPPQYILGFHIVRTYLAELTSMMVRFSGAIATMSPGPQVLHTQSGLPPSLTAVSTLSPSAQPTQTGTSAPIDQGLQTQAQGNGMPPRSGGPYARPTLQQMNAAMQYIRLAEEAYSDRRRNFQTVRVSEHEKEAYMQHFDQLWRAVQETEKKLIMYHSLFGDEASTSKLVAIIVTTKEQKKLLTTPAAPPQYILGFHIVRTCLAELTSMMVRFSGAIATMLPGPQVLHTESGLPPSLTAVSTLSPSAQTPPTTAASSPQA